MKYQTIAGATALLAGTPPAWADGYGYGFGYGPGMMGGAGWWGIGMIGMVLWWLLIILAIVLLVKWVFGRPPGHGERQPRDRSLDILKERYARGEIDKQEFEEKKRDLQ
jgi:putative membrane protein